MCNTYNVTTVSITKCEIIFFFFFKYTHKLQLTTNLSNPKNIYDPFSKNIHAFIVNNQIAPTVNNHDQPQPTKFEKKKSFSHILFSWETNKRKVVISLYNLLFDLLYQWHIFKQRQCLEGSNSICDTKWVEIIYDIVIYRHNFEIRTVQRIVKGRDLRFLKSNWDQTIMTS